nr:glycosyltransferase N-terminal domain-containing protein [Allomuricauda sp.]
MKLFVSGRKSAMQLLRSGNQTSDSWIWMHVASLGEYEQGLPILKQLRTSYPNHKLVLTFFSPSGYEVKKNNDIADQVLYLPMDTLGNVRKFLDYFNPELAIFIKYEIWPNYLRQLKKRNIPALLVSAIFSKDQVFFKPWGGFMRGSLKSFSHFFVQDDKSVELLQSIGHKNVSLSGDTRFDRVSEILHGNNQLDFMDAFKQDAFCLVAGSTWPEDEDILVDYINTATENIKFILAPHAIKPAKIEKLKSSIGKQAICYSEIENKKLSEYQVMIIDTIGLLIKIYSYADVSYVGGAFATGLHNTLEPAIFGVPVIIGPDYFGFKEAEELVAKKGILVVKDKAGFKSVFDRLVSDAGFLDRTGKINSDYIRENIGATAQVMDFINQVL